MTPPRAVLFDLGKVLVDFDWQSTLAEIADEHANLRLEELMQWVTRRDGAVARFELGRIDDAALLADFHHRFDPARRLDDGWIIRKWCDMFRPIPGALELVDSLRGRAKLGLVSNTNQLHFEWIDQHFEIRRRFDSLSLSHELGTAKPDPPIFEHALAAAGCEPAEAYFVDDITEYVDAARRLGIDAERFEGVRALRASLVARRVLD